MIEDAMVVFLPVTSLYTGGLTLLYITLIFRVVRNRESKKVSIGDGQDKALGYIIRVIRYRCCRHLIDWM